jgi:hypothetical protein
LCLLQAAQALIFLDIWGIGWSAQLVEAPAPLAFPLGWLPLAFPLLLLLLPLLVFDGEEFWGFEFDLGLLVGGVTPLRGSARGCICGTLTCQDCCFPFCSLWVHVSR